MAEVNVQNNRMTIDMLHKCGEMIQVEHNGRFITGYRHFGAIITQCPHCFQDLEWDEMQDPKMADAMNWGPALIEEA